jgi:hypothetical protein
MAMRSLWLAVCVLCVPCVAGASGVLDHEWWAWMVRKLTELAGGFWNY